jgi:hypothetical protein
MSIESQAEVLQTTGWTGLPIPVAKPVVTHEADGRLNVFGYNANSQLAHVWYDPGGGWGSHTNLGDKQFDASTPVAATRNQDGRIEVFARGPNLTLWHIWQQSPNNNSSWCSTWQPLGSFRGAPGVGISAEGQLVVVSRGIDTSLWLSAQTAPNNNNWSAWSSLGRPLAFNHVSDPVVASNQDGRLDVFGIAEGALWHTGQRSDGGGWSKWECLGGPASGAGAYQPVVGRNADGRLEAFVSGKDGTLWQVWQTSPNGGWAIGGGNLGGTGIGPLAVATNSDGRLEVFAVSTVRDAVSVVSIAQTAPNNGWGAWTSLSSRGTWESVAAGPDQNGRLVVFSANPGEPLMYRAQTTPGVWG